MKIEKVNPNIKYLYHYTSKKNIEKILKDKSIISKDKFVFFTESLNDSITAFEREMMQENKLYIDVDGVLRKREKCNKADYCILKIPYKNDNQFYKFNFENQSKESIYTISLAHKGSYQFNGAKVLEFPEKSRNLNIIDKTAIAVMIAGIMLVSYNNIYAASWLDSNNYDTTWYTTSTNEYVIDTAEKMAGIAYLVNNENVTFEEKNFNINADIDLTKNTWQTIKDIFAGTICGSHRIILNCLDGQLIENNESINSMVDYSYNVLIDGNELKKINVKRPYEVENLKNQIGSTSTVFFNNEILLDSVSLRDIELKEDDIIEVFSSKYTYIENIFGIKMPFYFESGYSIEYIKEQYSKKTNILQDKIVLKYNGQELLDNKMIADYNIQKFETIYAYVKINITTSVEEGEGTISSSQDTAIAGEKITITINPETGYELNKIMVNGTEKTSNIQNNELKIECGKEDINVKVSYKLKESIEENTEGRITEDIEENITENIEVEEKKTSINNPQTGDNIFIYIVGVIVSAVSLACTLVLRRTKKIFRN